MKQQNKRKEPSSSALLKLAKFDLFRCEERIHHICNHPKSWFAQNRLNLPKEQFYVVVHLRLRSINLSVVTYHYLEKGLKQGTGCKSLDESLLFEKFVSGSCQFRNDRLKLIARVHQGPWYFRIPARPAIIGRQVPIRYYRTFYPGIYTTIRTNSESQQTKTYDFDCLKRIEPNLDISDYINTNTNTHTNTNTNAYTPHAHQRTKSRNRKPKNPGLLRSVNIF